MATRVLASPPTLPPAGPPPFGRGGAPATSTSAHPLMAPMYWACADVLGLIPAFVAAGPALPSPADVRGAIEWQLSAMADRARSAGIVPEDIVEAQFALVALIDECLAKIPGWHGQAEWRTKPMQFTRFNENTAGETFFRRVGVLEGQPHRVHVLQIYYLCMAVGFQGRYAIMGGQGLAAVYDRVGARVAHASGPDVISPHGEPREGRGLLQLEAPLVRLGLGFFVFALVLFFGMRVALGIQVRDATRPMHDYAKTTGATYTGGKR